jgi:hypothetical protein
MANRKILFGTATCALLAIGALATSMVRAEERGPAESCIRSKVWEAYPQGWSVRTITHAELDEGEHKIYLLTLYSGNDYQILACGDDTMTNVDLVLYDADGKLIIQDNTTDRQPVIRYKPTGTDTFYVALHAVSRSDKANGVDKGSVAMAITYK